MNDDAERLKRDIRTIENALAMNLWTQRDVRRGLLGVVAGAGAGLFLAIWFALGGAPEPGLVLFLALLTAIHGAKGVGFQRQPAPAPGSVREIGFFNRFYAVGAILIASVYICGQNRGMEPLDAFASAVVMAGAWYIFYAISAPSRRISMGGALPLTLCGFLLPSARDFSQALCWLGIAVCVGCSAEAALLYVTLRPPRPIAPDAAPPGPRPVPVPLNPGPPSPPLCDASH